MTGDSSDRTSTFKRMDLLYGFHGQASGTFGADEHLAGLNPSRGTELCTIVSVCVHILARSKLGYLIPVWP